jgi:DNA-binding MarR family transcriptional regulator
MATGRTKASKIGTHKRRILSLPGYATYYFTVVANKLSTGASRLYQKEFGIGIIEWRIMAMLAVEPKISPARICQVIGMDKAAVSREMRKMEAKRYLTVDDDPTSLRKKSLELTDAGYELHDRVIQVALERERRLLSDLSPEEIDTLLDLLARTTAQIPFVNQYSPHDPAVNSGKRRSKSLRPPTSP